MLTAGVAQYSSRAQDTAEDVCEKVDMVSSCDMVGDRAADTWSAYSSLSLRVALRSLSALLLPW